MKRYIILIIAAALNVLSATAQTSVYKTEGNCGVNVKWMFDGLTLYVINISKDGSEVTMDDFDMENMKAPWVKKKLGVRKVDIGMGIKHIGSCSFANCHDLQEVVFQGNVEEIGWGAFYNCSRLRTISLPEHLRSIGTIAFGRCSSLTNVKIPAQCRVGNQAYISCDNLKAIDLSPTTILGDYVFASEVTVDNRVRHALYTGEILRLPTYVNTLNCNGFGLSKRSVEKCAKSVVAENTYDYITSDVDSLIPNSINVRNDLYALVIGNQNYRFASSVPYAIHDARVFADYCRKVLGIPSGHIHVAEDATKQMILEEELEDWAGNIGNREDKSLIVYYAGHGVPDTKNRNKAYILPTDVRGTNPKRGIALEKFYEQLNGLGFKQTSVFLDACFSGVNRDNEGVSEGLRAVEIEAEEAVLGDGSMVVFSAAQGNETAQAFPEQGHGLFTYYLLKAMQDSYGTISFGDLSDDLRAKVSKQAMDLKMRKKQTPMTTPSESAADTWRDLHF